MKTCASRDCGRESADGWQMCDHHAAFEALFIIRKAIGRMKAAGFTPEQTNATMAESIAEETIDRPW